MMLTDTERKNIVGRYVRAYNRFDVEAMVAEFDEEVIFKNIAGGEVTLELQGLDAFRKQAEQAAGLFSEREQKIENINCRGDVCEAAIEYEGKLACDLPNGLKAGDLIRLKGKSVFVFRGRKIYRLEDIS